MLPSSAMLCKLRYNKRTLHRGNAPLSLPTSLSSRVPRVSLHGHYVIQQGLQMTPQQMYSQHVMSQYQPLACPSRYLHVPQRPREQHGQHASHEPASDAVPAQRPAPSSTATPTPSLVNGAVGESFGQSISRRRASTRRIHNAHPKRAQRRRVASVTPMRTHRSSATLALSYVHASSGISTVYSQFPPSPRRLFALSTSSLKSPPVAVVDIRTHLPSLDSYCPCTFGARSGRLCIAHDRTRENTKTKARVLVHTMQIQTHSGACSFIPRRSKSTTASTYKWFGVAMLDRIRHACTEDTRFAGSPGTQAQLTLVLIQTAVSNVHASS
ncbi:hypothetical protein EXIGLDRAFT_489794 [Exidia glandulosa HHB12029]|uniref:Uncharacterized protein n=1 Tax=Exidia glandulosa HHB12029 TaxID=1314781 RepID=A0A166NCN2_EXIGL|nr:hypothetical protein EXIGLDRAFT_489794 [Exidia glandulosa HHB12029]